MEGSHFPYMGLFITKSKKAVLGLVHTYPFSFENATFFIRFQKDPRPYENRETAFSKSSTLEIDRLRKVPFSVAVLSFTCGRKPIR